MASTTNLGIDKINGGDYVDPEVFNNAFDKLDALGVDYVTESGTSGEWWYRKWKSGRAECGIDYKSFGTVRLDDTWTGSWYSSSNMTFGNYPFTFSSRPYTSIKFLYDEVMGTGRICQVMEGATASTAKSPTFYIVDATSGEMKPYLGIYVMGYYKQ